MEKLINIIKIGEFLYFLSNDKIKEGDWFYDSASEEVVYAQPGFNETKSYRHKIIATTDESLRIDSTIKESDFMSLDYGKVLSIIPRPSDSFIKKYIEEYNAGRQITKVLVEYEIGSCNCNINSLFDACINEFNTCTTSKLKVDSNNTITIKKVKDSYSREEVVELVINALKTRVVWQSEIDNWIKENL